MRAVHELSHFVVSLFAKTAPPQPPTLVAIAYLIRPPDGFILLQGPKVTMSE
jgi:hypothetical protein